MTDDKLPPLPVGEETAMEYEVWTYGERSATWRPWLRERHQKDAEIIIESIPGPARITRVTTTVKREVVEDE